MGAAGVMAYMQVAGIFGALLCGWISDRFFHSKRNMPALIYGLLYTASIAGFVWAPQSSITAVGGEKIYDFGYATEFWVGAALLSTLLALLVWNAKPQDEA